jgi:putative ABC transport system substrate-binding protein
VIRREFITLLGSAAAAWPLTARAECGNAMRKLGWVEGKDIHIEYRYMAAEPARFKAYAAEQVGLAPDILLATTAPSATALHSLTRSIPIVFVLVPDPVGLGFVETFRRPGGHMTGFISFHAPIIGKWVQLLIEISPTISRVAAIYNPDNALSPSLDREIAEAASYGVTVARVEVRDPVGLEDAIAVEAREPGRGVMVLPDSFGTRHRDLIIATANRHNLPPIAWDIFAPAGGLMSSWFDSTALHAQATSYMDRILKGENPPTCRCKHRRNISCRSTSRPPSTRPRRAGVAARPR